MGQVEIRGKVDIFQYWPNGASDVDTLQLVPDMPTAEYVSDGTRVPVAAFFQNGEARPVVVVDRNRSPLPDSFLATYP